MKTNKKFLVILGLLLSISLTAQTKKDKIKKKDSTKFEQKNLMDMQANVLTGIFGKNLDGKNTGFNNAIDFLELLEKTDFSAEEKRKYKNYYLLQSKNMNQKEKDSLNKIMIKTLLKSKNIKDEK